MQKAATMLDVTRSAVTHRVRDDHWRARCRETGTPGVRREALRRIPDAVGRNLEERSWVDGLPGRESARGQQHACKAAACQRRPWRCTARPV